MSNQEPITTFKWAGQGYQAEITARRASGLDGMDRSTIYSQELARREFFLERYGAKRGIIAYTMAFLIYPAVAAVTTGTLTKDGQPVEWPPTAEDFIDLPDELTAGVIEVVYQNNPHWQPRTPENQVQPVSGPNSEASSAS